MARRDVGGPGAEPDPDRPWWGVAFPRQAAAPAVVKRRRRGVGAVVALAAGAALLATAGNNPGQETTVTARGATIYPPTLDALADGCTGIARTVDSPAETGWVPVQGGEPGWDSAPPVSGGFSPTPYQGPPVVDPETGSISFSEALALLWRGWTVVWYTGSAQESEVAAAALWVQSQPEGANLVLAPWPARYPAAQGARPWTYTGWTTVQSCMSFSTSTAEQFVDSVETSNAPGVGVPLDEPGPQAAISTS